MLLQAIHQNLQQLQHMLGQLTQEQYVAPCAALDAASIGQHTRHIIEMYQCLENQYELGTICYDGRKRDENIQTSVFGALQAIAALRQVLGRPDKTLHLEQSVEGCALSLKTNYERELLYNLEHCIHHQALIKVALMQCPEVLVDPDFGVAPATIAHRQQCAR